MIRHKWSVGLRNKLSSLAMECDSCTAIDGAKITDLQRKELKGLIMKAVDYIDSRI